MAATYTLISSNVLSGSAASVTFSAIPQTYTDLVLRYSGRTAAGSGTAYSVEVTLNGATSNYSYIALFNSSATTVTSWNGANQSYINALFSINTPSNTANTFSNAEIYIPSYTSSSNRQIAIDSAVEDNSADVARAVVSSLSRNATAVTSITLTPPANFAAGSSFYLYGISNS